MRSYFEEARELISLAWPLVVANLATSALTATDLVFVGGLSPEELAGVSLGLTLYTPLLLFGVGVASAVSPVVAEMVGSRNAGHSGITVAIQQTLVLSLALGTLATALLVNGGLVLAAIGEPPELAGIAASYLHGLAFAYLPNLVFFVLRSAMSALGRPGPVLSASAATILFNVLANWALVFGHLGFPALGVLGSGIATTASQAFMTLALVPSIARDPGLEAVRSVPFHWRVARPKLVRIGRFGGQIGAIIFLEVSVFAAVGLLMGILGATEAAANAVANQVTSLGFMVPLGISQAATVRVGRALGTRSPRAVMVSGRIGVIVAAAVALPLALMMVMYPGAVASVFLSGGPEAARVGPDALSFVRIGGIFQVFNALQAAGAGVLRGVRDASRPLVLALLGYWGVSVPVGSYLAFKTSLGGAGLWLGLVLGSAGISVALLARWRSVERTNLDGVLAGRLG